jgi:hypothetical protein
MCIAALIIISNVTIISSAKTFTESIATISSKKTNSTKKEETGGLTQTGAGENSVTVTWSKDKKAYGYNIYISTNAKKYSRISNDKICDVSNNTKKKISNLKAGTTYYIKVASVYKSSKDIVTEGTWSKYIRVVTAPSRVDASSIRQTNASAKTVTVKWNASKGATGYVVYVNDKKVKIVKRTKAYVSVKSGSTNSIKIRPVRVSPSGYMAVGGHSEAYDIYAAPAKPVNVASFKDHNFTWYPTMSNKVMVGWTNNSVNTYEPDGYQVQIYSVTGKKKLKTYYVKNTSRKFNISSVKNKGFKIKVRGYITIRGKKYYGAWSDMKTVVPQAHISLTRTDSDQLTVSWKKVTNAERYYIYICKDIKAKKPVWKRVAVVNNHVRSYAINGCSVGKYNAVYVIPEIKIGSKRYKAKYTWYLYMYLK